MRSEGISRQTIRRLPLYLEYLNTLPDDERATISAKAIATALDMGEVKVRKDLAEISMAGRPKVGYNLAELRRDLMQYLAGESAPAVLVGAGRLGSALLHCADFVSYGLHIAAAFDCDEERIGQSVCGVPVLDVRGLADYCRQNGVRLAVLTVPASAAQTCVDELVKGGVKAVWSFAPIHVNAPEGVLVQQENLNGTLAILTQHLKHS